MTNIELNNSSWFLRQPRNHIPKLRVFCFPYAGGNASIFSEWQRSIHADVEIVAIQPPGRANRVFESPLDNMFETIKCLMDNAAYITSTPYVFLGYSLGSRISFELAMHLQAGGYRLPLHLIVCASRAPHLALSSPRIHNLPDSEFTEQLKLLSGTPQEILENREMMELLLPMLKADFKIAECFRAKNKSLNCPITVLGGKTDSTISTEELSRWNELTTFKCDIRSVCGGHFFINENPSYLLQLLNSILTPYLGEIALK
jgi:surfactin synthase thioesterase subunit